MSEPVIEVKNLRIGYRTSGDFSIKSIFSGSRRREDIYYAVNDVSFTVNRGEVLGVIGQNGSGKSTLLRAIAGIFSADEGYVDIKGNKVSLLSIGVGFNPVLNGRDNVYLSGMLLGFTKAQIDERIDGIIAFSEIGDFIDKPVNTYSSGMYSRLAFSITAVLETDIVLIDEVLSVGDEKFAKKSYYFMQNMMKEKRHTVLFVSHTSNAIKKLCDRVLWLHEGKVMEIGETDAVLQHYSEFMS